MFVCCLFLFICGKIIEAKIVFCIEGDIFVSEDNATNRRQLTKNTVSSDHHPRWSPDGKRIVFYRYMDKEDSKKRQISSELFIINADGTDIQRLTHNDISDKSPSWSPDGKKIVYQSKQTGRPEVYVMELASGTITQLTGIEREEDELASGVPDWSPDGTQIIYERFINNGGIGFAHKNVYVMSADGKDQRPIFPDPEPGADVVIMRFFPRWSADGKQIVFKDSRLIGDDQITHLTITHLGGGKRVIQDIYDRIGNNLLIGIAYWMENDRALLFDLKLFDKPNPNYNLYRYELKTRNLRRLTQDTTDEKSPHWTEGALSVSPRGKKEEKWGALKN